MREPHELGERPQSRREWQGVLRSLVYPLSALVVIAGLLWYLDSGGRLPLVGRVKGGVPQDANYKSLEARGIKLGAAGGPAPKVGQAAPDFTLVDLEGKPVTIGDLRGKTVVLNFWATWCIPCKREFPKLIDLYEKNRDRGLVVIGLNVEEDIGSVRKFAGQFGANYPILLDTSGSVSSQYRIQGLPVTWFIDSQGIAQANVIGELTDELISSELKQAGFEVAPARTDKSR